MRVEMIGAAIAAALTPGGAQPPLIQHAPPRGGETITYRRPMPPMCIGCHGYTITLGPDGQGILEVGEKADVKEYRFQAGPEEAAAFTRRLRPYRPNGAVEIVPGGPLCKVAITDQDQVEIEWTAADGRPARLVLNEGCDVQKHRKMIEAVRSAPSLLPIKGYTGLP